MLTPLNSCSSAASDWLSSFQTFADKLLIRLGSYLVDKLIIMVLTQPDYIFGNIAPHFWPLVGRAAPVHLQTNHKSDWAQIALGLLFIGLLQPVNFGWSSTEFRLFPEPWWSSFHPFSETKWLDWAKIWWANSLSAPPPPPSLLYLDKYATKFLLLFTGLCSVKQLTHICRQTTHRIGQRFDGPPLACLTVGRVPLNSHHIHEIRAELQQYVIQSYIKLLWVIFLGNFVIRILRILLHTYSCSDNKKIAPE